jgi:hypothetical protein
MVMAPSSTSPTALDVVSGDNSANYIPGTLTHLSHVEEVGRDDLHLGGCGLMYDQCVWTIRQPSLVR